jgi:multidrug efflux system membrane fusion protein
MTDVGNIVSPSDANGIVVITQVSPINVSFAIPEDRVPEVEARIAKGGDIPVTVLDRTRATALDTGKFAALDNLVDVQTGTVRAKAVFTNTKGTLFPSQFVNVRLLLDTIHGLVVPVTAVRHGSNGDFVYVLNAADHTVAQRTVTRGHATVDKVEITSGLKQGEQVITEGADRLKDGAHVMLPGDKPAFGSGQGKGRQGQWGTKQSSADAGAASASNASSASSAPDAARREAWKRRRQQSADQ